MCVFENINTVLRERWEEFTFFSLGLAKFHTEWQLLCYGTWWHKVRSYPVPFSTISSLITSVWRVEIRTSASSSSVAHFTPFFPKFKIFSPLVRATKRLTFFLRLFRCQMAKPSVPLNRVNEYSHWIFMNRILMLNVFVAEGRIYLFWIFCGA